jgi:hypothetical protein
MRNIADVTGGKPIAVLLQSIAGVSAINPLVTFYDIHGGKREVLLFCPGHHTRLHGWMDGPLSSMDAVKGDLTINCAYASLSAISIIISFPHLISQC